MPVGEAPAFGQAPVMQDQYNAVRAIPYFLSRRLLEIDTTNFILCHYYQFPKLSQTQTLLIILNSVALVAPVLWIFSYKYSVLLLRIYAVDWVSDFRVNGLKNCFNFTVSCAFLLEKFPLTNRYALTKH